MKVSLHPTATHAHRANPDKSLVIRCRQGQFDMYPRPELPNPNTPDQQLARQAWSRACAAWNALLPEEKARWNRYAAEFGSRFPGQRIEPMTGYRVFQSAAGGCQVLGLPLSAEPPRQAPPEGPVRVELLRAPGPTRCAFG